MGNGVGTTAIEGITAETAAAIEYDFRKFLESGVEKEDAEKLVRAKYESSLKKKMKNNGNIPAVRQDKRVADNLKIMVDSNENQSPVSITTFPVSPNSQLNNESPKLLASNQLSHDVRRNGTDVDLYPVLTRRVTLHSSFRNAIQTKKKLEFDKNDTEKETDPIEQTSPTNIRSKSIKFGRANSIESIPFEPKCFLCNMMFLTKSRLDKHITTSELHARNLKLIGDDKEKTEDISLISDLVSKQVQQQQQQDISQTKSSNSTSTSSDVGILIYAGSEFFTRTNDNIDIHLFLHNNTKTLEIIPYDTDENKELDRIFLSLPVFTNIVGSDVMKAVANNLEKRMITESLENISPDIQKQSAKLLAISTEILHHLEIIHEKPKRNSTLEKMQSSVTLQSDDKRPSLSAIGTYASLSVIDTNFQKTIENLTNQQIIVKRIAFKHHVEDKNDKDPNINDPYIPRTTVVRTAVRPLTRASLTTSTGTSTSRRSITHVQLSDITPISTIESVVLSKRHLDDAIRAAQKLLDLPQRFGIEPRGRRSIGS